VTPRNDLSMYDGARRAPASESEVAVPSKNVCNFR
jgi:hypothetical protein